MLYAKLVCRGRVPVLLVFKAARLSRRHCCVGGHLCARPHFLSLGGRGQCDFPPPRAVRCSTSQHSTAPHGAVTSSAAQYTATKHTTSTVQYGRIQPPATKRNATFLTLQPKQLELESNVRRSWSTSPCGASSSAPN